MHPISFEDVKSSFFEDDLERWDAPPLDTWSWDFNDFIKWQHYAAGNYYACVPTANGPVGMVFEMNNGNGVSSNVCGLCYARNNEVGVKAAWVKTATNPRRKVGMHVCADLGCSLRVRGTLPGHFYYETISKGRRIERLQTRLEKFANKIRLISE